MMETEKNINHSEESDKLAYALMQSTQNLIASGNWDSAAHTLEEAAAIHQQAGRSYDESRCLQFAATLKRGANQGAEARTLIQRAGNISTSNLPLRISLLTEQAEIAMSERKYLEAFNAWDVIFHQAQTANALSTSAYAAVLMRRAECLAQLDRLDDSYRDYNLAFQKLKNEEGISVALWVKMEQANVLFEKGKIKAAEDILNMLDDLYKNNMDDKHLASETDSLRSKIATKMKNAARAVQYALRSRAEALESIAPLSYFKACVALCEAYDLSGKSTDAYGALATAWSTLSDLIGKETAHSWIQPCLFGLLLRWGEQKFNHAKSAYEERRRIELKK